MMRHLKLLVATTAILMLVAVPVLAQTGPSPAAPPAAAADAAGPAKEKLIEGPVKRVDPMTRTVQVGWFLGLLHTTLELTDDTRIMAEGRKGSLFDIQEGAKVKASYETRDGKNVARSIEVLSKQENEGAAAPAGSPAGLGARAESPGAPGSGPTPPERPTSK
jgi:hypothetical protein